MKILSIIGSPRKGGNTAGVVNLLNQQLQNYRRENLIIETLQLSAFKIGMCKGCRVCFNKGEKSCPLNDDIPVIKQKINEADILIISSPVYVEDVSGLLKNWFDRMAFISHRPEFSGKAAYILSTSGVGSTNHTLMTMNTALRTWGFLIIGQDTFKTGDFMKKEDLAAVHTEKTNIIAKKIVDYYTAGKHLIPTFLSLLTFKIQQLYYEKSDEKDSLDYAFWTEQNWLDPKRTFYTATKTNPIKVFFARALGSLIAKLVLK